MAAQVREALQNGEPQPFHPIGDISQFGGEMEYIDLYADGSALSHTASREEGGVEYWVHTPEATRALMSDPNS